MMGSEVGSESPAGPDAGKGGACRGVKLRALHGQPVPARGTELMTSRTVGTWMEHEGRVCHKVRSAGGAARVLEGMRRQMDRADPALVPDGEVEQAGWYGAVERREVIKLMERHHRKCNWTSSAFYKAVALLDRLHLKTRDKTTGHTSYSRSNVKLIALAVLYVAGKMTENRANLPPPDAFFRQSELMGFMLVDFLAVEKVVLNHVTAVLTLPDAVAALRAVFSSLLVPAAAVMDEESEFATTEPAMTPPTLCVRSSPSGTSDAADAAAPAVDAAAASAEGIVPLDDDGGIVSSTPHNALHQRSVSLQLWGSNPAAMTLAGRRHRRSQSAVASPSDTPRRGQQPPAVLTLPGIMPLPELSLSKPGCTRSVLSAPAARSPQTSPATTDSGCRSSLTTHTVCQQRHASSSAGSAGTQAPSTGSSGSPSSSKSRVFVSFAPKRGADGRAENAGFLTRTGMRAQHDAPLRSLLPRIQERFCPVKESAAARKPGEGLALFHLQEHGVAVGARLDLDKPVSSVPAHGGDVELLAICEADIATGFGVMDVKNGRGLPYLPNTDMLQVAEQVLRQCLVESMALSSGNPIHLAAFALVMGSLCTCAVARTTVTLMKHLAAAMETHALVTFLRRHAMVAAEYRYADWIVPPDFAARLQNAFALLFEGVEGARIAQLAAVGAGAAMSDDLHDAASHMVSTPSPSSFSRSAAGHSQYYTPKSHWVDSPSGSTTTSFRTRSATLASTISSLAGLQSMPGLGGPLSSSESFTHTRAPLSDINASMHQRLLHSRASSMASASFSAAGDRRGTAPPGTVEPSTTGGSVLGGWDAQRDGTLAVPAAWEGYPGFSAVGSGGSSTGASASASASASAPCSGAAAPPAAVLRPLPPGSASRRRAHEVSDNDDADAEPQPVPPPVLEPGRPRTGALPPTSGRQDILLAVDRDRKSRPLSADESALAAMLAEVQHSPARPSSAPCTQPDAHEGGTPSTADGSSAGGAAPKTGSRLTRYARNVVGQAGRFLMKGKKEKEKKHDS